ncbi:bacillithiol system redox-active protein YtxJ [Bacillus taeanensis]|uniref:Bacillithiol system redox-active protein YtxJ n=1 Tax=Bacillus taeanensis TaxID=273032 RepID=A0A366Y4Y3_9BACI|nr:bacillithiol system redox-active protein YtxJ [Bacillus taeanensis]RBW71444.1 bacillithiol system redox-active protein YtxJ [Bacillus taeanensis]
MGITKITAVEDFQRIKGENKIFFLLKNSTTCPISSQAYEEYQNFSEDYGDVACYYLNVQEARPLSNTISEHYEIKHESPQAFLIKEDRVLWHHSHWNITYSSLKDVYIKNVQ